MDGRGKNAVDGRGQNAVDGRGNTVDWRRMPWMDEMPWMDGRGFWGLGL